MELWVFFNSRTRLCVNRVYQMAARYFWPAADTAVPGIKTLGRGKAGAVHNRAAACVAAGGGIFENHL